MPIAFVGITLEAPSADPSIGTSGTFAMSAGLSWSGGHGGNEATAVHFEYSTTPGGPYSAIPASGSELTTADANPAVDVVASPVSITVTGAGAGTYYVRVRGVAVSEFSSAEQVVTVSVGAITGTMSVQESGSDTFTGSGAVDVTGTMSVQESGSDVFTGSGTVGVTGTMSVQESGSDTFTGSGSVADPSITGTMSVQESGSDVFSYGHGAGIELEFKTSPQVVLSTGSTFAVTLQASDYANIKNDQINYDFWTSKADDVIHQAQGTLTLLSATPPS